MIEPRFTVAACAWAALRLWRERKRDYPAMVAAGALAEQDADEKIAVARAIAAQWRWAVDPSLPPFPTDPLDPAPFGMPQCQMMDQLRTTASWEHQRLKAAPADLTRRERAELADALVYYQDAPAGAHPLIVRYALAARRNPSQRFAIDPEQDGWAYEALQLPLNVGRRAA